MPENIIRTSGAPKNNRDDSGGAVVLPHACLGIVKDNIDPTHSGRIRVYISRGGAVDPDDARNWYTVSYMSPWFGVVAPGYDIYGAQGSDREGYGKYKGNPHSYGFWASAPDLGTQVICIFVNGRSDQGFYIGCVPQPGLTHMVPAVASSTQVVPNSEESKTYGGADRLPVTEVNYANPSIRKSPTIYNQPKPVHSYQASILAKQGIIRDNLRGVISSSSQRETPSRVFGISTPGGPIYSGGYDNNTIKSAAASEDTSKLQTIGRTGGHSIVLDDGDISGQDQLLRIRTAAGHMIMMNDSGQNLTIIHSNGQSWIELGREGTIDMYATNSVNIRTEGDLNLHADRDINMHAKRNINAFTDENIRLNAEKNMTVRTGENFNQYTVNTFTVKVDGPMSMESKADASYHSKAITYINGRKVHLNTGQTGTVPKEVKVLPRENHVDTTFSPNKGWMNPSPEPLISVVTRTPTHWPWAEANKGVNVKTGSTQPASQPQPSAAVQAANQTSATQLGKTTTPSLSATAPTAPGINVPGAPKLPSNITTSMVSQQATAASALSAAEKVKNGIVGTAGSTLTQLAAPGQSLKPGSDALIKNIQNKVPNIPGAKAATNVLMTGNKGVGSFTNLEKNIAAQAGALTGAFKTSLTGLTNSGVFKGTEAPTEIAGIVQAASNFGTQAVAKALSTASAVTSAIGSGLSSLNAAAGKAVGAVGSAVGSAFSSLGSAIAGGNFAGALADKASSAMGGISNSLNSLASGASFGDLGKSLTAAAGAVTGAVGNAVGAVSGAVSGALGSLGGAAAGLLGAGKSALGGLLNNLKGTARNAFAVTEKAFGELKAGAPNVLGNSQDINVTNSNPVTQALESQGKASEDYETAQQDLDQARKAYKLDPSPENQTALKEAESAMASALKKGQAAAKQFITGAVPSAQNIAAGAAAIASGANKVATTLDSGLNAIPGGVGAYANEVTDKSQNVLGAAKALTGAVPSAASMNSVGGILSAASAGVGSALSDPTKLAGNIVNNAQQALAGAANNVAASIQASPASIASAAAGVTGGLAGALGAGGAAKAALGGLAGNAKSTIEGMFSKTKAALDSLGDNDNQIKTPTLASATFAAEAAVKGKVGQLLGDTKIPQPIFEDRPVSPDVDVTEQQKAANKEYNTIKDLVAQQKQVDEKAAVLYARLKEQLQTGGDVTQISKEIAAVEVEQKELAIKINKFLG